MIPIYFKVYKSQIPVIEQAIETTADSEVLRAILQRYAAINRRDAIQPAFDALLGILDRVRALNRTVIERAKPIVLEYRRLSARVAAHLSVMEQNGIEQILSFDSGFDPFPGIASLP